jgi:hypothetical protein
MAVMDWILLATLAELIAVDEPGGVVDPPLQVVPAF